MSKLQVMKDKLQMDSRKNQDDVSFPSSCCRCKELAESSKRNKLSRKALQAWHDIKLRATVERNRRIEKSIQVVKYKQIVHLFESTQSSETDVIRLQVKCQQLQDSHAILLHHLHAMKEALESLDLSSSSEAE